VLVRGQRIIRSFVSFGRRERRKSFFGRFPRSFSSYVLRRASRIVDDKNVAAVLLFDNGAQDDSNVDGDKYVGAW
jgi:hypothetical protein